MIGHHTRLRENDDLPLANSGQKEKAAITRKIMRNAILRNDLIDV